MRRLYEAATGHIAFVEDNHRSYPHEFSYEETVQTPGGRSVRQRVELTLWDAVSVREHAVALGYRRGIRHHATETLARRRYSASTNRAYYVEYNATKSHWTRLRRQSLSGFWISSAIVYFAVSEVRSDF